MKWAQLVVDALRGLAWPCTVVVIVLVFRRQIAERVGSLREAEFPGGLKFRLDALQLQVEATPDISRRRLAAETLTGTGTTTPPTIGRSALAATHLRAPGALGGDLRGRFAQQRHAAFGLGCPCPKKFQRPRALGANRLHTGLPEIPSMDQFSPQVLRETFAYYLGRSHELGDIITGFQFGHTKATITASYQHYRPDDSWNQAFRQGQLDGEIALLDSLADFTGEPGSVVGRHGDELRSDAMELRATILTDPEAGRRIAARHADTWHHGEILSCRFDQSTAVCHKLAAAAGISETGDGPLHDLCIGSGCVNVHFTRRNLAPLRRQRADIAARLALARTGSIAQIQAQEELDRVDKIIAQLQSQI